jgi:hypothetical protein
MVGRLIASFCWLGVTYSRDNAGFVFTYRSARCRIQLAGRMRNTIQQNHVNDKRCITASMMPAAGAPGNGNGAERQRSNLRRR